jgi:hypothetical protein
MRVCAFAAAHSMLVRHGHPSGQFPIEQLLRSDNSIKQPWGSADHHGFTSAPVVTPKSVGAGPAS